MALPSVSCRGRAARRPPTRSPVLGAWPAGSRSRSMLVSFTKRTPASVNNQPRPQRWEAGQILTKRPRTPTRRRVQHLEQPSPPGTEIRAIGGRAFLDELKEDVARLEAGENATSVPASGRRARSEPSRVRRGREASQIAAGFGAADATVPRPDHVRTGLMIDRREADALDRACMVALSRSFLRTAFRVSSSFTG